MIFEKNKSYVGGKWVLAHNKKTFEVINPATNEVIYSIADMGVDDTKKAIDAAEKAWKNWSNKTAKQRSDILKKWHSLIIEHTAKLAEIATLECGKPILESKAEVAYGAAFVEWFAEEAKRTYGDVIPTNNNDRRILTIKQPVGVVAAITPWNFPIAMITRKCAPALAAGCPVIIKPAEKTPLSALYLAKLAEIAGFDKGVINIITTSNPKEVGLELSTNKKIRKLSFTGSTNVGKILAKQCAGTVKKLSLELGGNAPFIVFNDADIDLAVKGGLASKYRNTGQTCVCTNRFLIQSDVYDEFAAKFKKAVNELVVGDGSNENTTQGPLINKAQLTKVKDHVEDARKKGANILLGGSTHKLGKTFYKPTILTNVNNDMKITNEETFGPVAALVKFDTEDEAIAMANDTQYGLAAYFYTKSIKRTFRVSEALEYGMVGVNEGVISTEIAPFGGVKESGIGREGSKYGIDEFIEIKYICIGGM